ncbi:MULTISPECIES: hypothetical protein [unclassified Enterobacter]|uniref:hypothetical protein n=1 Tax=unclassified Enterobacter TaxID=2608935 RepID=UPI002148AEDA|nr:MULTISPECIES: hypothetical protein [unclassified Enterobacter]MCR1324931.1 hypothetical protein [Enterobacter sp. BT1268]MCR1328294.1 hypothetical protein [Enterobacter sp. BT1131]
MGIETIIGLAALVMAAIAGAFGIGHSRGTSKAEAKADQQRTEEKAAATEAVAERLNTSEVFRLLIKEFGALARCD